MKVPLLLFLSLGLILVSGCVRCDACLNQKLIFETRIVKIAMIGRRTICDDCWAEYQKSGFFTRTLMELWMGSH